MNGFRKCEHSDLDFILALKRLTMKWYIEKIYGWDEDIQREMTARELDAHIGGMRIMTADGRDIGVTTFYEENGQYVMGLIMIDPEYQGRGIASAIISDYIGRARSEGKKLLTKAYKHNPAAKLYEKLGFAVYGEDDTHLFLCIGLSD